MVDSRFSREVLNLVPRWLQGENASRILLSVAEQADDLLDSLVLGTRLRFPNYRPTDPLWDGAGLGWGGAGLDWGVDPGEALMHQGRERKIRRGRFEGNSTFAGRLSRWLDDHRTRGNMPTLLSQLNRYYANSPFPIASVSRNGVRHDIDEQGNITRSNVAFEPDDQPFRWARFWLFYIWPGFVTTDGIWSDPGLWSDGGTWDSNLTIAQVEELKTVILDWRAGHVGEITLVLIVPDSILWDDPRSLFWGGAGLNWGGSATTTAIEIQVL